MTRVYISDSRCNLEYKIEGTDWQDFIPEDKRAYSDYEYKEFVSLLEGN